MNGLYDLLPGRADFDESKYQMGSLCRRKHDWMETGQSLRLTSNGHCPQCDKEKYQANLEENRRKARERMRAKVQSMTPCELQEHRKSECEYIHRHYRTNGRKSRSKALAELVIPPRLVGSRITADDLKPFIDAGIQLEDVTKDDVLANQQMQQALQGLTPPPSVARLVMDEQQRHWRENPDAEKEHKRQWGQAKWWLEYQTRPELRLYNRQKARRRKAQMRESVAIQITGKQIRQRFAEFDHHCAYCGAAGDLHIEHVVPISKGGPHAIGNIIPACKDCNFSKRDHEAESWYRRQPFFTEARWRKICRTLGWGNSSIGQLALL